MNALLDDPWIAAQIDAAVAPYVGKLTPAEIAWMREQLAEALVGDERAARLLCRARPVHVDESGEVRRDAVGAVVRPAGAPARAAGKKAG